MSHRQRNIIAQLPMATRQEITSWLLDGQTYDAIRAKLTTIGISPLPHNTSFLAWRKSDEYTTTQAEYLAWRNKAEQKRIIAQAINDASGSASLSSMATYQALEALIAELGTAETSRDIATLANAIGGLTRATLAQEKQAHTLEMERKAAEIKARLADNDDTTITSADLADAMDELLGVGKK
jgi:hypothetical protein